AVSTIGREERNGTGPRTQCAGMSIETNGYQLAGDLLNRGRSPHELSQQRRNGTLERIRWGVYAEPVERTAEDAHRMLVESSLAMGRAESVASFVSAAVIHELPVWSSFLDKVHLTRSRSDSGRIRRLVHVHVAPLTESDVATVDGVPVTSLARTVVDHARTVPLVQAVAAGDRALLAGLDRTELDDQLEA